MKVLISGASGLVGTSLCHELEKLGMQVSRLVRQEPKSENEIYWNSERDQIDLKKLEGFDVIINLAGENISEGRWTDLKKKAILQSRVDATHTLVKAVKALNHPPKTFINASAIGYYGDAKNQVLFEENANGEGFLAKVCKLWENEAKGVEGGSTRLVILRFGIILSKKAGALAKMLTPFKLGLGGKIGSGKQYMSWVALDDVIGIIEYAIKDDKVEGIYNVVSPYPVNNEEFTKTLGKVLRRPTVLPLPEFMCKIVFGEMGEELLLGSQRVCSEKIEKAGYHFKYPHLEFALGHLLS